MVEVEVRGVSPRRTLSATAMAQLCGAISAHPRLERLCLAGNHVGSEGMGPVVALLARGLRAQSSQLSSRAKDA